MQDRWTTDGFDYYDQLGLKDDATSEELKRARNFLADRLHPDKTADDDGGMIDFATEATTRVNIAYEVLSDPERRARYDTWRREVRRKLTPPLIEFEPLAVDFGTITAGTVAEKRVRDVSEFCFRWPYQAMRPSACCT